MFELAAGPSDSPEVKGFILWGIQPNSDCWGHANPKEHLGDLFIDTDSVSKTQIFSFFKSLQKNATGNTFTDNTWRSWFEVKNTCSPRFKKLIYHKPKKSGFQQFHFAFLYSLPLLQSLTLMILLSSRCFVFTEIHHRRGTDLSASAGYSLCFTGGKTSHSALVLYHTVTVSSLL